jgi:hypothetical protein
MHILKPDKLKKMWLRILVLFATFLFLTLIFASPSVRYTDKTERDFSHPPDKWGQELIKTELGKANDEIKFRIEQQESWYHYKFIFIGGMVALFLGQTGFLKGRSSNSRQSHQRLKDIITAESTYSILALACVLALIVDMHIRNNMISIQRLGLWIANYVEPAYVDKKLAQASGFYPWEQFIRPEAPTPSLQLDTLSSIAFSLHLHFMTTFIFLLYLIIFHQLCLKTADEVKSDAAAGRKQLVFGGFVIVLLSILAFIFVAHAVPSQYEMRLIPSNLWVNGLESTVYYTMPWIFILLLNLPYLLILLGDSPEDKDDKTTAAAATG